MTINVVGFSVPSWALKTIISTIITLMLGGLVAAATKQSGEVAEHDKRLAVMEEHQKGIDQSLSEIKQNEQEQSRDTKEILKRLPRR